MPERSLVPKKVFFTKGIGVADDELLSFELALRNAKIEKFNLVPVSSIAPPRIEIVDIDEGLKYLNPGQVVFTVLSRFSSNINNKEIYSSVGVALPKNKDYNGYFTEYHGYYTGREDNYAKNKARFMLETAFNIDIDSNFEIFNKSIVEDYTTVISAAVFIF
ncbi:pyruvoyl-dependent arginine decarboxylase [Nanobdella aerobiophila]|uniref:Pyruvoyl-dependent arginine decarboxylase n=1 Tax=Nanobdella aerobiophila TaxID=2586965 RepID=A0A915SHY4_9ARCH|nr:arginine decarboxylase, pyruvoyl-dependent [Nanobdella aerobiophila]BBL45302.1 pyruvoyl-dependent arginine decarboxylase [Nanobdella aerobiophila]